MSEEIIGPRETEFSFREKAMMYQPTTTKTIAEAGVVDLDTVKLKVQSGVDSEGKSFEYEYFERISKETGLLEKFRVPASVKTQVHQFLQEMPDLKKIKVGKTGDGLKTRYQVYPVING